jgi:hypothetical protein
MPSDLDYVDQIAERAVQLGGVAEGTARMVAKRSSLAEYPASAVDSRGHVEALSSALAAFAKAARQAIDQAGDLGDLDIADLFTEVSRGIDPVFGRTGSTGAITCAVIPGRNRGTDRHFLSQLGGPKRYAARGHRHRLPWPG